MNRRPDVSIARHQTSATTPAPATVRTPRRGQILIVDDDRLFATAMERCLAPEHDVVTLHSADDALRLLDGGARFDLIFCDLAMPDMSGMDFFAALTRRFREHAMRTVFLTGGAFSDDVRSFLESVPNPCLEKPFDVQTLTRLTREWVGPVRPDSTTAAPRSA